MRAVLFRVRAGLLFVRLPDGGFAQQSDAARVQFIRIYTIQIESFRNVCSVSLDVYEFVMCKHLGYLFNSLALKIPRRSS